MSLETRELTRAEVVAELRHLSQHLRLRRLRWRLWRCVHLVKSLGYQILYFSGLRAPNRFSVLSSRRRRGHGRLQRSGLSRDGGQSPSQRAVRDARFPVRGRVSALSRGRRRYH